MRKLVLDTNVLVSAYGFGGKSADLLRAVIEGEFEMVTSPALLAEFADKLHTVLGFDDEHVRAVIAQLARIARIVRAEPTLHVLADEPDNRVLECALASSADAIVSGDHHLLDLGDYGGIPVLRVAAVPEI